MRIFSVIIILLLFGGRSQAQTWDEWFKQRKTQIKYLVEQIAALKIYADYVKEGYSVASKGLTAINSIKNGDFDLHNNFFASLAKVKPAIRNSTVVAGIVSMHGQIVKQGRQAIGMIEKSDQFTASEMSSLKKVFDRLLEDCLANLGELTMVVTNGELMMKDDERIQRIERIRVITERQYRFCRSYIDDSKRLAVYRMMEHFEVERSGKLYGLPK